MGHDFKQYLKHYMHVVDIESYDESRDKVFLQTIEGILESFFGERIIDFTVIPCENPNQSHFNVYAYYDKETCQLDENFLFQIIAKTINAVSAKSTTGKIDE